MKKGIRNACKASEKVKFWKNCSNHSDANQKLMTN